MNTFKLQDLILEGRLEDVKKKYPEIKSDVIDYLSQEDPSGNNKYLEWMVAVVKHLGYTNRSLNDSVIESIKTSFLKNIKLFHENVSKLEPNFISEVLMGQGWDSLLRDNSPAGKMIQKILKTPKDINSYSDYQEGSLEVLKQIVTKASEKLTKAEIKRLESEVLLNTNDLLILIPKSYKASCFYGAGTRWCTTNRESDTYYKKYTTNGTLIYVIDKKSTMENPWYRTAFFINREDGDAQAFDAPDNPTSISTASKALGDKWEQIRDTIIEYLHKHNLKGIDNFYVGPELLSWLESKGLDPLELIHKPKLLEKLGSEPLINYLQKRGISPFEYFDFKLLFKIYINRPNTTIPETMKTIWDGYIKNGFNPVDEMFSDIYMEYFINHTIGETLSLDEFLDKASSAANIFNRMSRYFGDGVTPRLLKLFNNSVELVFGFADLIEVNLFSILEPRSMRQLLNDKFDYKDALNYTLKNIDHLEGSLSNYGFTKESIFENLSPETIKDIISKGNFIKGLNLDDFIILYGRNTETFWRFFKFYYGKSEGEDVWVDEYEIRSFISDYGHSIRSIFPNIFDLQTVIQNGSNPNFKIFDMYISTILEYLNEDYYKLYQIFKEGGKTEDLNDLYIVKAYEEAPTEDIEIKELAKDVVYRSFGSENRVGSIVRKGDKNYVLIHDLCNLQNLFYDDWNFLCNEDVQEWTDVDRDSVVNWLDKPEITSLIKEHLMTYLRDSKVTLNIDWIDEFDAWAEDIDDVNDTFTFKLFDERIHGMSNFKLETIIMHSPELIGIRRALYISYKDAYNQILTTIIRKKYIDKIEDAFGSKPIEAEIDVWSQTQKSNVKRQAYLIEYNYMWDDVIAYTNHWLGDITELPSNIVYLIENLMNEAEGRFDGNYRVDIDDIIENWSHSELHGEEMLEELSDILYSALDDIDYSEEQKPIKPQRKSRYPGDRRR